MAAETGFLIDENFYEVPDLSTFTMDEAQVLYDYSGLSIEDFVGSDADDRKFRNPGFLRALMHVAYQRGNPNINANRVKALIGSASLVAVMEQLAGAAADAEVDAGPPELTTVLEESSPRNSDDSKQSSGSPSASDSAAPVVQPAPTTDGSSQPSESTRPTLVA